MGVIFLVMSWLVGLPVILLSRQMAIRMKQDLFDQRSFHDFGVTTIQVMIIIMGCLFITFGIVAYKYLF